MREGRRKKEEGRRKREEGRGKKEEGRRKREEGRRKKEEGRRKKEEGRTTPPCPPPRGEIQEEGRRTHFDYAQCPMPDARCPIPNAPFPMSMPYPVRTLLLIFTL
ncbi:hypothetical protein [Microcoleus sp.]|uniref:hypothetical protein n=1 Tax=Microcoleus sp. TaxID=44472 RepID=UPI0035236F23